jgi:hypothetical protein
MTITGSESGGEEDEDLEPLRPCPECRGRCEDRNGDPCEGCYGEGWI